MQLHHYRLFRTELNVKFFIIIFYVIFGSLIYYRLLLDPGIWNYGDTMFPFDMTFLGNYNNLVVKTWWDHEYLGHNTIIEGIGRSSFVALLNFGYLLFKDMSTVQFGYWVFLFTLSGTSMFWLVTSTFEGGITAFSASLLYALNPWIINRIAHVLFIQAYAFIPLIYTSYVLWLDKKEIKYIIYFIIASIFILPSPHFIFIVLLILVNYFLFRQIIANNFIERVRYIIDSLKLCLITISFLSLYFLPIIGYLFTGGQEAIRMQIAMQNLAPMATIYGRDCTLINVIRLLGFHDSVFRGSILGSLLSSEQPSLWVALSFIMPFFWTIPLLFFHRHRFRDIPFFYFLILVGIFLSTITTLFDTWLFQHLVFIPFINDPNIFVSIIAFSSATICGIAISIIKKGVEDKLNNTKSYTVKLNCIIIVTLILLTSYITYPNFLWTDRRYEQISYPQEYYNAANYIDQNPEDSRVLMLPPYASVRHKWAPYIWLQSSDGYLFSKPFFGRVTMESTPIGSASISLIIEKGLRDNSYSIVPFLSLTNTRYILVTDDIVPDLPYLPLNPNIVEDYIHSLNSQEGILLDSKIGDIYIYKLEDSYFLPHIYFPEAIYYVKGSNLSDILWLTYLHNNTDFASVFSTTDNIQIKTAGYYNVLAMYKGNPIEGHTNATGMYKIKIGDKFNIIKGSSGSNILFMERMYFLEGGVDITVYRQYPDGREIVSSDFVLALCLEIPSMPHIMSVEKIDSTEYVIRLRANQSFYFVFSESFDNNWRASISDTNLSWIEKLSPNYIDDKAHSMVNGFANMWYVNPYGVEDIEFTITIYYWPQSLYIVGLIITTITTISFMVYFIWRKLFTKTLFKSRGKSSIERSS